MSRLVEALAQGRQIKTFTCPRTGIELEMRQPVYRDRFAAELDARKRWGKATIENPADLQSWADLVRACLIGRCLYEADATKPIGAEILAVDEDALEAYDAVLSSIESPPAELWTQDEVDAVVELIKKKDPGIAACLRISEGSTLFGLVRSLVARLTRSPTKSCSSSSTGASTTSAADAE